MIIDILIIILLLVSIYNGYHRGFVAGLFSVIGIMIILTLCWFIYPHLTPFVVKYLHASAILGSLFSFIFIFIAAGVLWNILTDTIILIIPVSIRKNILNKVFGIIPGILYMFVYISVVGWFILNYPLPKIQPGIDSSRLIKPMASVWNKPFLGSLNSIDVVIRALGSTSADAGSNDPFKKIDIPYTNLTIDAVSEQKMLELINLDRTARGLKPLTMSPLLQKVARTQARDMWVRQFFSHIDPDGGSPFDRLNKAKVPYIEAGENLALAPDVVEAEKDLMNSTKHRENILYPTFKQVGIGIVKSANGNGSMFVQEFSN